MRPEYVRLALTDKRMDIIPSVANRFIQTCSVRSKQKPNEPERIHKKGSTFALFQNAQKSGSYYFVEEVAMLLKENAQQPEGLLSRICKWVLANICCLKPDAE